MRIILDELTISRALNDIEDEFYIERIKKSFVLGTQYGGRRLREALDEQKHRKPRGKKHSRNNLMGQDDSTGTGSSHQSSKKNYQ